MKYTPRGFTGLAAAIFLAALMLSVTGLVIFEKQQATPEQPQQQLGDVNAVAGIVYYLYGSGVSLSDSSITLTSFKQPVNAYPLAMADFGTVGYLTLEPGSATRQEFVSFTGITQNGDGSATLTGVTRGLSPVSPFTASTTIRKAHAGGSQAVVSNPPQFYERFANKVNTQYITGAWGFQGTAPTSTTCATANELCNKAYVDAGLNQGAATSTEMALGLVQLATAVEIGSSTASSTAGGPLVIENKHATTTPGTLCTGNIIHCIPVALAGKISQLFLDLTAAFTFSGGLTSSGATSIAASVANPLTLNTVATVWPSANGSAGTFLSNDGAGTLSWSAANSKLFATSTSLGSISASSATTTIWSMTVPANTMGTGNVLRVVIPKMSMSIHTGDNVFFSVGYGTASTSITVSNGIGSDPTVDGDFVFTLIANSATSQVAIINYAASSARNTTTGSPVNFGAQTSATLSQNSANALTLIFQMKFSSTNAGNTVNTDSNPQAMFAELLR